MLSRVPRPALLLCAAWALVGCARGEAARASLGGVCRTDRDCVYGLTCRGAPATCAYEDYGPCAGEGACLPGRACREGRCTVACLSASDCKPGEACSVGECRAESESTCVLPGDCPSGEECVAGRCQQAMRGPCLRDAECPPPQRCIAGACR